MLVKILGVVDALSGLVFLIMALGVSFSSTLYVILGIILLAKSALGMLKDFASWIDFLGGLILLLSITITLPKFIIIVMGVLVCQKAFFSFMGEG